MLEQINTWQVIGECSRDKYGVVREIFWSGFRGERFSKLQQLSETMQEFLHNTLGSVNFGIHKK